jgi:microcystin-dependent protein
VAQDGISCRTFKGETTVATPFLGEVKIISWNFAPKGWAFCNGQLLPINQNQALFSILGTTYGGDGRTTFGLPDLRGRSPVHVGEGIILGERGGEEVHTLNLGELPAHNHNPFANTNAASAGTPLNNFWSATGAYAASPNNTMNPAQVLPIGGSQAHNNLTPFLVLNFVIALVGIFPSQN